MFTFILVAFDTQIQITSPTNIPSRISMFCLKFISSRKLFLTRISLLFALNAALFTATARPFSNPFVTAFST